LFVTAALPAIKPDDRSPLLPTASYKSKEAIFASVEPATYSPEPMTCELMTCELMT